MAEALLRIAGRDRFEAHSAGSRPAGFVHDLAIAAMSRLGVPLGEARSKSWDEFVQADFDVVITLCDDAASESCPTWPGAPLRAHWPVPDPAFHPGTDEERIEFAVRVAERLRLKIEGLTRVDFAAGLDAAQQRLDRLGAI